ncbi:MAG: AAA family ATPase [Sandaracinaceae bacterium]|nr:AAA family ATPase [Sandaracinaceae bacterium]
MHLDFAELDKIYDAGRTTVYGGLTLPGGRKAVVKTIRDAFPSRRLIRGLRQEQRLLESLNAPGIIKSYGLVSQDGWLALLIEDFGGVSLATACRGRRLNLDTFLEVAIGVADALASVHEAGIIHKDVSPGNIVWNVDTGVVKLVDFGISVRASHDRALRDVSELEGTLAYIAPEQTGRTHRRIDWRTDLYSLGCTLYDALLGRPPFDSTDILELVHAHLAVAPRPAHEVDSSVPVALSNVLARLLEKNGEDRYQSAFGLATDLRRIRAALAKTGHCEPFELTTAAAPNRLEAPDKLYGRERELAWLRERFRDAAGEGANLCLISGYSGIGKTALVEHAEAENVAQQGTYVAGKFDQFKRGVPYASLISAFEQLVGQLVAQPAEVTRVYRVRILEAVEPNAQVLIDVIPDLRLLLGDQPAVADLPAAEAENRLNVVLGRFVRALPDPGRPFVIFLDDLQWADLPSLHAIGRFVTDPQARHLLIVGAYRENEVGAAHPLRALIERVRDAGRLSDLQLGPLTREDTHALVRDAFGGAPDAAAVADICHEKTAGNPFFLNQFLQGLYERQLVRFDYEAGIWRADLARLREQDFTDNVVEFMSQKVGTLEGPAQRALSVASVIGNQFRLDQLGALLGDADAAADGATQAEDRALTALDPARALGLIYVESGDVVTGRFSHDRVQQAAYERLAKDERDAIHHQLGKGLLAAYHGGDETQLFDATNHLNHVPVADLPPSERRPLAELNLRAARQARASSAYHVAYAFAQAGLARQPQDGFERDYRLTADLHLEAAESAFLTGDYAAMERELDTLLKGARDVFDEVRAYEIRVVAQNARNDLVGAMQACLDALAKLGIVLDVKPTQGAVVSHLLRTKLALRGKSVEELSALPASRGRHEQAASRLLMSLIGPAYYASPNLLPIAAFTVVRLALDKGVCAESATGFALYGLVLCTLSDFEGAYRYGQVGMAIAERFEGTRHANRARHLYNTHVRLWKEPWIRSADALELTHERAYANGDFEYAAFSGFMRGALLGATGRDLQDVTEIMAKAAAALAEMQQNTSGLTLGIVRQAALNLRKLEPGALPYVLQGEAYDERVSVAQHREASDTTNLYCYLTTRMRLAYLFGEDTVAYAAALESAPLEAGAAATFFVPDAYFYECLTRLKVEPTLGAVDRAKSRARLLMLQRKLAKLAAAGPMNITPRIDMIAGELARLRGQSGEALEAFDRAVRGAREQGYTDIEALALELAGRLQLERNNALLGHTYLRAARAAYERWGALEKVARLVEQYPFTAHGPGSGSESRTASTVTTSNDHGAVLDLETATRASRAISEEIVLSRLVERLMRVVVENAGAERGVLVLSSAAGPHVVAVLSFVDGEPVVRHAAGDPLETSMELSLGIARWVLAAGRAVVLEDAARRGDFVQDPYVRARQPRSILCAPIEYQGTLRGLIYLENNLARGGFTSDRIQMLQLLTAQAAVSIENAQLYDSLELKVAERTRQLELRNEFIRKTFGRYLSDDVVDSILDEPRGLELGGELRRVSVVMADLRGFSTAASALPPEDVLRVINHFLAGMTEVIFQYGGTIDEVLGDGLLVLFGAPVSRPDDADRAVACAIAMQSAMAAVNARNAALGLPQLEMGIGIHTGEAVVGNLGSDKRAKYGVVGTVVNLAARIEGLTTGGQVLISSETSAFVSAPLELRASTTFQPKGASTPLSVFEVTAIGAPFDQRLARAEHPLIDVTPFDVEYAVVTDVDAGERRTGQVVALSDVDVMVVGSVCPELLRDVCLDLPGLGADARIYGKVVSWPEPGRFVVRLTAVPSVAAVQLAERRASR